MPAAATPQSRATVLWILWGALFVSLFLYQINLRSSLPPRPPGHPLDYPAVYLAAFALFAATVVRWLVLPRAARFGALLVCVVGGLALSESVTFFELFLLPADLPQTRLVLFILSVLSALQFVPVYPIPQDVSPAAPGPDVYPL